jgi:hypothetical protein
MQKQPGRCGVDAVFMQLAHDLQIRTMLDVQSADHENNKATEHGAAGTHHLSLATSLAAPLIVIQRSYRDHHETYFSHHSIESCR